MKARIVDGNSLSTGDTAAWGHLLRDSAPAGNPFFSSSFIRAASEAYGRVEVCIMENEGRICGIFPYQFPSSFAAAMRAAVRVGEEMSDYFGGIFRPEFKCTPQQLLEMANLNYIYFTSLEQSQPSHGLLGEQHTRGLRILLPDGGPAYLESLQISDPKFSKDTERRQRKAVQDLGALRFCLAEPDPAAWLPRVIAEKRAQYLRTKNMDWLAAPGRRKLLEILAHAREPDCSPVVSTLWFGDTWAAIHFGLRSHKTLHYWFPVYNTKLASYAPGRLLLQHVIANAQYADIEIIDRGSGESQAKRDFPSERRSYYSGTWYRPGMRAFVYRAYQSAKWRISSMQQK